MLPIRKAVKHLQTFGVYVTVHDLAALVADGVLNGTRYGQVELDRKYWRFVDFMIDHAHKHGKKRAKHER